MTQSSQSQSQNYNFQQAGTVVRDRITQELERKHSTAGSLTWNDVRQSIQQLDFTSIVRDAVESNAEMKRETGASRA